MTPQRIGTAGWGLPAEIRAMFSSEGSGLARYAARFNAVEINSSFYRPHRRATYERWAGSVPTTFCFAVKVPKTITHERRLHDSGELLDRFLSEVGGLGDRLGPLLVQLPPSLAFDTATAGTFIGDLRQRFDGDVAWEPRHPSWFDDQADALLATHRIARVAADPALLPIAGRPGGWGKLAYWRLHGSPRVYYAPYDETALDTYAAAIARSSAAETWCVFDNTAAGHAAPNALSLIDKVAALKAV